MPSPKTSPSTLRRKTWREGDVVGELRHLCGVPLEESFEDTSSSSDEDTRARPSAIVNCTLCDGAPAEGPRCGASHEVIRPVCMPMAISRQRPCTARAPSGNLDPRLSIGQQWTTEMGCAVGEDMPY